jgi:hypothetical protein
MTTKSTPYRFTLPEPTDARRHPLIALYERDPWLMVVGSDVPSVVVYEDGSVLYVRPSSDGGPPKQLEGHLAREEAKALAETTIGLISADEVHVEVNWTDQPTTEILARSPASGGWTANSYYGLSRRGLSHKEPGEAFESRFYDAVKKLAALDPPGATVWRPETIEIMLWDFSHARGEVAWPKAVPAPPAKVKPPERGVYKHFIDGQYEQPMREFLAAQPGTTAIALNGRKCSVGVRRVVPDEPVLQAARQKMLELRAGAASPPP